MALELEVGDVAGSAEDERRTSEDGGTLAKPRPELASIDRGDEAVRNVEHCAGVARMYTSTVIARTSSGLPRPGGGSALNRKSHPSEDLPVAGVPASPTVTPITHLALAVSVG